MKITILSVGTKPPAAAAQDLAAYQERMQVGLNVQWKFIAHSKAGGAAAKEQEAAELSRYITEQSYLIVLDERGVQLSSEELSSKIFSLRKDIVFVIGGAYGVDRSLLERADFIWSLSKLVFPHQLVRLLLAEQLYRAQCIHIGHPYHHT